MAADLKVQCLAVGAPPGRHSVCAAQVAHSGVRDLDVELSSEVSGFAIAAKRRDEKILILPPVRSFILAYIGDPFAVGRHADAALSAYVGSYAPQVASFGWNSPQVDGVGVEVRVVAAVRLENY